MKRTKKRKQIKNSKKRIVLQNKTKKKYINRRKSKRLRIQKGGTIEEINSGLNIFDDLKEKFESTRKEIGIHHFNINSLQRDEFNDIDRSLNSRQMLKDVNRGLEKKMKNTPNEEEKERVRTTIENNNKMINEVNLDIESIKISFAQKINVLNEEIKKLNETFVVLEESLNKKHEELKILINSNLNEIYKLNHVERIDLISRIQELLKINILILIENEKSESEEDLLKKINDYYMSILKYHQSYLQETKGFKDAKEKANEEILKINVLIATTTEPEKKTYLQQRKKEFETQIIMCNSEIKDITLELKEKFENGKASFLNYIDTNIILFEKVLFDNTNEDAKTLIEKTIKKFELEDKIKLIKDNYEKKQKEMKRKEAEEAKKVAAELKKQKDAQAAAAAKLKKQQAAEAAALKKQQDAQAAAEAAAAAKLKKQQDAQAAASAAAAAALKKQREYEAAEAAKQELKRQNDEIRSKRKAEKKEKKRAETQAAAAAEQSEETQAAAAAAEQAEETQAAAEQAEEEKQKTRIPPPILLEYWKPILKNFLQLHDKQINISEELLKIKNSILEMLKDEVPSASVTATDAVSGNSCKELIKIVKNFSGIEKEFQGTMQNITRETCMISIVMAFISDILNKTRVCKLLLKGSGSITVYTNLTRKINDLDFIILPYYNESKRPVLDPKELAFKITSLAIWLLSDEFVNLLLINTFINSNNPYDREPKQLINLENARNFQLVFNEDIKSLFYSLNIEKNSTLKIVLATTGGSKSYRYYPIIDIGYGFEQFDNGLKEIYRSNISNTNTDTLSSTTLTSSSNNLSFNYLNMNGLFNEICYNLLYYYLNAIQNEPKNAFYISKVSDYLKIIVPLTQGFQCMVHSNDYDDCLHISILHNLIIIYKVYFFETNRIPDYENFKQLLKDILNGFYNNTNTDYINRIVEGFSYYP
jgi:hypothetical protein